MQQIPTRESWQGFRTKPFEWFKDVADGKAVNPYALNENLKPYRPKKED